MKDKIFKLMAGFIILGVLWNTIPDDLAFAYAVIMNLLGLEYVWGVRKKEPKSLIYGLGFASMYTLFSIQNNMTGEWMFNLFLTLPMLVYGIYQWYKNKDADNIHVKLKPYHLNCPQITLLISSMIITIILITIGYGANNTIIWDATLLSQITRTKFDILSTGFALYATFLTVTRYDKVFYFWSLANLCNFIAWLSVGQYGMALLFGVYLVNGLVGVVEWNKK